MDSGAEAERVDHDSRMEMAVDENPKRALDAAAGGAASPLKNPPVSVKQVEGRDDSESCDRMEEEDDDNNSSGTTNKERVVVPDVPTTKKSTKPSPSKKHHQSRAQKQQQQQQQHAKIPSMSSFPHHGMHGYPSSYPPPPPYGYGANGGGPRDHHFNGGPPPPPFHQMPPMPHQGPYVGGGGGGPPYHPPPHPGMSGAPYHPGYHPAPYHPMQYHVGMHHHHQPPPPMGSFHPSAGGGGGDNDSVSSKSKGSKSRKKRTIDGVHEGDNNNSKGLSAFTFRRTFSNASTNSTVTVGNNTSAETAADAQQPSGRDLPQLSSSRPDSSTMFDDEQHPMRQHRRDDSIASTASSLSVEGFSLESYEGHHHHLPRNVESIMRKGGRHLVKASPKRRRGQNGTILSIETGHLRIPPPHLLDEAAGPERFQQLSMNDSDNETSNNNNKDMMSGRESNASHIFLTLSTSPMNQSVDATPVSKNTKRLNNRNNNSGNRASRRIGGTSNSNSNKSSKPAFGVTLQLSSSTESASPISKMIDQGATPPLPEGTNDSDTMTDEHLLNRHLRGQSFTPLPHGGSGIESRDGHSSSPNPSFSAIAPQLSWDAPSLGELADWEEHIGKSEERRPGSSTSMLSSNGARGISPASLVLWKDGEDKSHRRTRSSSYALNDERDYDGMRLLSPNSDTEMRDDQFGGTTTPLPVFFGHQSPTEERENMNGHRHSSSLSNHKKKNDDSFLRSDQSGGDASRSHPFMFSTGRHDRKSQEESFPWTPHFQSNMQRSDSSMQKMRLPVPPTPLYTGSDQRDDPFGRASHNNTDRRDGPPDFFISGNLYGMLPHHGGRGDRVRNLRGRAPPGGPMFQSLPHLTPSHRHSLASPIGVGSAGKNGMWGPGGMQPHHSPGHMPQLEMNASGAVSKRKCVPLKPPIPSKYQGDFEKAKSALVPEFTSLVNFPAHMSQKQSINLPEGMRCCVMCGQACPCSQGKSKKAGSSQAGKRSGDTSLASRKTVQESLAEKTFAIIPTQNKGLCTLCDVNVWVVVQSGLEIKWCKGCKNFRPWAAFGDKGLATKCLRCRERQREKYALQKEEKERARLAAKSAKMRS